MRRSNVIFDIDGTLVDSTSSDGVAYVAAVHQVLGSVRIRPTWAEYEHVTDAGIFRQICRENNIESGALERSFRNRFGDLVADQLRQNESLSPIPGGVQFLNELRTCAEFNIGIATGGWGHTARMKLNAAGYEILNCPLASSDDAPERVRIMECCHRQLPPAADTAYFGDGDWDRRACEALGWRFIGVGHKLRGHCSHWIPDFSDAAAARALLG